MKTMQSKPFARDMNGAGGKSNISINHPQGVTCWNRTANAIPTCHRVSSCPHTEIFYENCSTYD